MIEPLFSTNIIVKKCNLDVKDLEIRCRLFQEKNLSVQYSNRGGYQGHGFNDDNLIKEISHSIPQRDDKPIKEYKFFTWVNINQPGSWNERHNHNPHAQTFLSGVFYVKVPKNSGRIRLFDPRSHINTAPDMVYYNDGNTYHWYEPEENMLLIFPSWLEHDVEVNNSREERISIAFNVKIKSCIQNKLGEILSY